jgi:beta-glucosidase-like glycosyl hydrolase
MLDIQQKFYQLVISRLDGEKLSSMSYQKQAIELVQKGIGGFILFGGRKDKVKEFIHELQSIAEKPLFIASDIECGVGQQIQGATCFPCQMAVSAAIDINKHESIKILEEMVNAIACEASDIGINMPLIPVMDVNQNPDNPIICTRAFSDDPEKVAGYGRIYIKILENSGLISCAKHFPGHGDTDIDSHISLPVISKSIEELTEIDIFPFSEAVKTGVSSIMVGHLGIPAIDTLPASLSEKIITDLLRNALCFEGLILTDALTMHALNEIKDVPVKCINAGVDLLLHPVDADTVVKTLKRALSSGEIKEEKIDTAIERIIKFKSKIKDIKKPEIDYHEHARLASIIFDRSITLIKDSPGWLPVNVEEVSLIFKKEENDFDLTPLKNFFSEGAQFIDIKNLDINKTLLHKTLILALFTSIAAWKGSSGIRDEEVALIKELIRKSQRSIVISFGNPYVLRHFQEADVLIAAYDTAKQTQTSVIKCLRGEGAFQGIPPVKLFSL